MNRINNAIKISLLTLIALAVSTGASVGTTEIDSCAGIDSPGDYTLNVSITNIVTSSCINITSSDVVFDGAGYIIDGIDAQGSKGVYVYNPAITLENVTVKNVTATDWDLGIYYLRTGKGLIYNNEASSNNLGIALKYSSNNTLTDNTAGSNSHAGIYLNYSNSNTITGNTAGLNSYFGIKLVSSRNNTIYNNILNNTNNSNVRPGGGGVSLPWDS